MDVQLPGAPVYEDGVVLLVSLLSYIESPFVYIMFFSFGGDSLQNSQDETKILKKTVTKALKIDTNGGHTGKSVPRDVIMWGSQKSLDRSDRVVFFLSILSTSP